MADTIFKAYCGGQLYDVYLGNQLFNINPEAAQTEKCNINDGGYFTAANGEQIYISGWCPEDAPSQFDTYTNDGAEINFYFTRESGNQMLVYLFDNNNATFDETGFNIFYDKYGWDFDTYQNNCEIYIYDTGVEHYSLLSEVDENGNNLVCISSENYEVIEETFPLLLHLSLQNGYWVNVTE